MRTGAFELGFNAWPNMQFLLPTCVRACVCVCICFCVSVSVCVCLPSLPVFVGFAVCRPCPRVASILTVSIVAIAVPFLGYLIGS